MTIPLTRNENANLFARPSRQQGEILLCSPLENVYNNSKIYKLGGG